MTQPVATRTQDGATYRYTSDAAPGIEVVVTDHGDRTYDRRLTIDGETLHSVDNWPTPYPDAGTDYVAACELALVDTSCTASSQAPEKSEWLARLGARRAGLYPFTTAIWSHETPPLP